MLEAGSTIPRPSPKTPQKPSAECDLVSAAYMYQGLGYLPPGAHPGDVGVGVATGLYIGYLGSKVVHIARLFA